MMLFAVLCWGASLFIPKTARAAPDLAIDSNLLRSTGRLLGELWADTRLWRCAVVTSIFWLVGAVLLSLLPSLVMHTLGGAEPVVTIFLAVFAVAIGVGSSLAAWLSAGRIILLPTAIGALLIGLCALDLGLALLRLPATGLTTALAPSAFFARPIAWHAVVALGVLAVAGGLMIVPSFAAIQAWALPERRARAVAAVNVLNAAFMVGGALIVALLQKAGVGIPTLFLGIAGVGLLTALWIGKTMPTNAFHDFLSILLRAFYRLEVKGRENLDKAGPNAIVALNHVSFLDGAVALSILDQEPVFAVDHGMAQRWWARPLIKLTRAMPLDPARPLGTRTLIQAVRNGDTLVIFPEGRITVTGQLMKVYDGAALIAEKSGAMIVPVRIEGLEATIFSRLSRAQVRRRWFPKVKVTVLEPVRLTVDDALKGRARRQAAGAMLYQIMSDLIFRTTPTDRTVVDAVVEAGKIQGWSRIAVEDPVTGKLSYRKLMVAAAGVRPASSCRSRARARRSASCCPMPNGAAATLLGMMSAGRVPAMINFTAGVANVLAACAAAEVGTIVTSRAFVEKGEARQAGRSARREGPTSSISRICARRFRASTSSAGWSATVALWCRATRTNLAAILFTSGSEGTPKGVVLSHRNMLCNAAQAAARIDFGRTDKVFNTLPVFHAFGLTVGLVLPLVSGVPVFLYPSPLHYRIVPELVYGANATILFGTDTFLSGYARAAHPYDFRSVRYVLAGAEPVKEATRRLWSEKFGLRILEGYGVTETAPALALNTPMFNRFGTVGRLLPGIEARLEQVPGVEEGGRLYVRGPNVMLGYLQIRSARRAEPPPERLARYRRHRDDRPRRLCRRSRAGPSALPRSAAR